MRNNTQTTQRNLAMDLIRSIAVFLVISVHFFLHSEFYTQKIDTFSMFIPVWIRTICMSCVPLFLVLSGYLNSEKKVSVHYYKRICKILGIYVLASVACWIYKLIFLNAPLSVSQFIKDLLSFKLAPYSWYIEMYLGLFLIIPFINLMYQHLETKRQKQLLVLSFMALSSFPSIFNIYRFDEISWWLMPSSQTNYHSLLPDWWTMLYPITYYFLGAYFKEFKPQRKPVFNLILWILFSLINALFVFYRSYPLTFMQGIWQNWESLPNLINTCLIFLLLLNIKEERHSDTLKNIVYTISDLSLGAYLVSWIFDHAFYQMLNQKISEFPARLPFFLLIVPAVFLCSLMLSAVINLCYHQAQKLFYK